MWMVKLTAVVKVELQGPFVCTFQFCSIYISEFLYFDIRLLLFHEHAMNTQFFFSLIFLLLQSRNMNFIMAVGQISFPFRISKMYIFQM